MASHSGTPRPVVGITTYVVPAKFGVWDTDAALVPNDYVTAIENAGGRALLVPPSTHAIDETLDALDGLIFSGGCDLDPDLYGQSPHPETTGIVPERDTGEIALMKAALERELPILGICRGSQVLNVTLGGDLIQHLPEVVGADRHKEIPGIYADHDVAFDSASRLATVLGERHPVKSHHHQGFGRIGTGLRATGHATDDGTPEALEHTGRSFAIGVLWHPEVGEDQRLFNALVAEAARYRKEHRA